MGLLSDISKNWKSLTVIGGIFAAGIVGWNYTMAAAEETAQKAVDAKVNQAMIDGAKRAAADAVKEQLPEIAKQVAQEVAKQVVEAQKAEAKRNKPNP